MLNAIVESTSVFHSAKSFQKLSNTHMARTLYSKMQIKFEGDK